VGLNAFLKRGVLETLYSYDCRHFVGRMYRTEIFYVLEILDLGTFNNSQYYLVLPSYYQL